MENPDYFTQPSSYRINYNMRAVNNDPLLPPSPSSSTSSLPRQLTEPALLPCDSDTKKELIHQATTRLRCKTLLYGLDEVKSKVAELQSELDNLRIEVHTTENVLSKFGDHPNDRQLQALEKRFITHQQRLDHVLSPSRQQLPSATRPPTPPDSNPPMTLSSTLLRVSSIFCQNRSTTPSTSTSSRSSTGPATPPLPNRLDAQTTTHSAALDSPQQLSTSASTSTYSSSDYDSDTASPSMKNRRKQRRERVKQIKQKYQASIGSQDWNTNGNWTSGANNNNAPTASKQTPPAQPPKPCKGKSPKLIKSTPAESSTIDKRRTTGTRKPMTTSTAPKPAQCLCKRKTNKPEPVKHHKAASSTSRTYHSKHPEMVSLQPVETTMPEPVQDHTTAALEDEPPLPLNVTQWLEQQQDYEPVDYDSPPPPQIDDAYNQVLQYLDTFSDFDSGLQQDITDLLSPLKSTDSMYEDDDDNWDPPCRLYSLLIDHGMARLSHTLLDGMRKGLDWCKFLSVLAVALLISLGRGPDHMLLSLDDLYYLECLAENGGVQSYFL